MTRKIPQLLVFVLILLAGCGRDSVEQGPASASSEGGPSVSLFLTMNMEQTSVNDAVPNVSSLYPHRVVVWVANAKPGAAYDINAELFDGRGKSAWKGHGAYSADAASWWYAFTYRPPEEPPKPGDWKWRVTVSGLPDAEREFEMLEPSDIEKQALARHQKARESIFYAFSMVWVAVEDFERPCFVTALTTGRDAGGGRAETRGLLEVSGLDYSFDRGHVTEADLLNGITYRGRGSFSFTVYRTQTTVAWDEWKDVVRYNSAWGEGAGALARDLRQFLPGPDLEKAPNNFAAALQQGGYHLVFDVIERDGHWFVDEPTSGARWIDLRLVQGASPLRNASPRIGFVEKQIGEADTPRKQVLKTAEEAVKREKAGPAPERPDILHTMKVLREKAM